MANKENFSNIIEVLEENKITIPLIQRDFAFGREKEKYKAERFLEYLLKNEGNKNLDFIYGFVKEGKFIPIDGQQRLTILFLLYFYSRLKSGKYDGKLKKFTYGVRPTSEDFLKALTDKDNFEKLKNEVNDNGKSLKEAIENSNWFFKSWLFDPTVKAVLNMLDWIEKEFEKTNIYLEKHLENITFSFLKLDDYGLTDDIYVKMNARGKPITPFENLKAEIERYFLEDEYLEEKNLKKLDIQIKFDNKYLDIFWEIAKEKKDISEAPKLADKLFYRFLYFMFLSFYFIKNREIFKNKKIKKRKNKLLN